MQYVQRRLQRSRTEILKSFSGLASVSVIGVKKLHPSSGYSQSAFRQTINVKRRRILTRAARLTQYHLNPAAPDQLKLIPAQRQINLAATYNISTAVSRLIQFSGR